MGLFSWIGDAVHDVGEALGGIVNGVSHGIGAVTDLLSGNFSGALGQVESIFGGSVAQVGGSISGLVNLVEETVKGIAHFSEEINTNLIDRFVRPITETIDTVKELEDVIHGDIAEGIKGIIKIPGQIAESLTNEAAILHRTALETIDGQKEIVNSLLVPHFGKIASEPLDNLSDIISQYTKIPEVPITDNLVINLKEPPEYLGFISQAESFINFIKKDDSWMGRAVYTLLQGLYILPVAAQTMLTAETQIQQNIKAKNPLGLLGLGDIVQARIRGEMTTEQGEEEALKQGIDPTRLALLEHINFALLSADQLVEGKFRGLFDEEDLGKAFHKLGYTDSLISALYELHFLLPTPAQAMVWYARSELSFKDLEMILGQNGYTGDQITHFIESAYIPASGRFLLQALPRITALENGYLKESLGQPTPESIKQQYATNLISEDQANLDWLAHWDDLGASQWIKAYYRKVIDRFELERALRAHAIPEELDDMVVEVDRELIPIWLVPELFAGGKVSPSQATVMLEKLGLDDENVKIMTEYGMAMSKKGKATNAVRLHQLSMSNLNQLFKSGIIDKPKYIAGLIKHGYSPSDAELIFDLLKVKDELHERDEKASEIITEVNIGKLTRDEGLDKLYSLGYSDGEVSKYVARLHREKVKKYKLPTEGQLDKMLEAKIISDQAWRRAMRGHGYTNEWIAALYLLLESEGKINAIP